MNHESSPFSRDQNINYGNDQYIVYVISSLPKIRLLKSRRFIQYILVVLYLLIILVIWIFLGFFTVYEYPISYVLKLTVACLQGSESVIETLKSDLTNEFSQVQENDLKAKNSSRTEYERLSRERARLEINEKVLRGIYGGYRSRDQSVSTVLDAVEQREQIVDTDLEPLKRRYDPSLYKLEELVQSLLGEKDSTDKDIERIKGKLDELIGKYEVRTREASKDSIRGLIVELDNFVRANPDKISNSRLKVLGKTLDLLNWAYSLNADRVYYKSVSKPNNTLLEFLGILFIFISSITGFFLLSGELINSDILQNLLSLNPSPQPTIKTISPSQEQLYWDQLHRAVSVWDIQTAQESLTVLKQSQNLCISEFAIELSTLLNSSGANGFKRVNYLKEKLNEKYNCNFEIPISGYW
ncbi:MAG: hypothetical protein KME27_12265 [Lyngbya sp. HA4199-MV5]|jgi:hypothetical protein|nr:hypothetical protein [Lyngbya sp. HA4199-MV5]